MDGTVARYPVNASMARDANAGKDENRETALNQKKKPDETIAIKSQALS
jgi:hypothetical protein